MHTLLLRMMSLQPVTSLLRKLLRSASLLNKLRRSEASRTRHSNAMREGGGSLLL
jgi:hypothetical protein